MVSGECVGGDEELEDGSAVAGSKRPKRSKVKRSQTAAASSSIKKDVDGVDQGTTKVSGRDKGKGKEVIVIEDDEVKVPKKVTMKKKKHVVS